MSIDDDSFFTMLIDDLIRLFDRTQIAEQLSQPQRDAMDALHRALNRLMLRTMENTIKKQRVAAVK